MIWNDEVKDWLAKNMNEFRNSNGRLSIGKLEDAVVQQFDEPMDQGEFVRWTEENKIKQCDGIKRLKKRLGKKKPKPYTGTIATIKHPRVVKSRLDRIRKLHKQTVTLGNDVEITTSAGQTVNWKFDHPTKSNLETLDWNGKTYILLSDCLKLLNTR